MLNRCTRALMLVGLLLLVLVNTSPSQAQGPEKDTSHLRHGPAVDSDYDLSARDRESEQREFETITQRQSRPAAPPAQTVRVYVLDFNPTINGTPLVEYRKWNDPTLLMQVYDDEVQTASWHNIGFQIVKHSVVDGYPAKPGGFVFTNSQYLGCLNNPAPMYCLQIIDYQFVLNYTYDPTYMSACAALSSGEVDEIWLWGGPFFGYWEYVLAEPRALCLDANANFVVMGFSYERTDAEMLHDLGHRSEDVLQSKLGLDLWDRFDGQRWRYTETYGCPSQPDGAHPPVNVNNGHLGNVHFPPNAYCHYQYTRDFPILSDADDWLDYPHLAEEQATLNSPDWGTYQRGFLLWWFQHFPHTGAGADTNWWVPLFERVTTPTFGYYLPLVIR